MQRPELVQRAQRLEYLTIGWNVVEGIVSVAFALAAGSIALLGFGIDSFVETASGVVILWRLRAEKHARSRRRSSTSTDARTSSSGSRSSCSPVM